MRRIASTAIFALSLAPNLAVACWEQAGQRYGMSPQLLYAMARVESSLNPAAVNNSHRKRTGTYDIGLMQINSSHLPTLARHGIQEADLYDPCINLHVGATEFEASIDPSQEYMRAIREMPEMSVKFSSPSLRKTCRY